MATLLEPERDEEVTLPEGEELQSFDTEDKPEPEAEAPAEPEALALPDKYVGKTAAELIAMHQEAERFNGKQSGEVGELRRSVDQLIQAQLASAATPAAAVEEEDVDFFEDPQAAIDKRIQNHPDVVAARTEAANLKRQTATQALAVKHPDMANLLADDAFLKWVGDSNVRRRLFQSAHTQYDTDAADELFSNWKERQGIKAQTLAVEKKERKQQVASADTGNSPTSTAGSPRKMYRRADVIRLMNTDPDRYLSLADEIMQAYAEGRVIN